MDTKVVMTSDAPAAVGPYSQAVEAGGLIFVAILKKAGTSMDKVVKTTIYLKNLADFAAVNEVYASFFNGSYPARSCFEVAALPKGAKVEIEAIAAL